MLPEDSTRARVQGADRRVGDRRQASSDRRQSWRDRRRIYRATHPGSPVLFAICMAAILLIGWGNDRNSCLRQEPPRQDAIERNQALRDFFISDANFRLDEANRVQKRDPVQAADDRRVAYRWLKDAQKLVVHAPVLDCSGPFPATK